MNNILRKSKPPILVTVYILFVIVTTKVIIQTKLNNSNVYYVSYFREVLDEMVEALEMPKWIPDGLIRETDYGMNTGSSSVSNKIKGLKAKCVICPEAKLVILYNIHPRW